jgi:hypothetical protein
LISPSNSSAPFFGFEDMVGPYPCHADSTA